MKGITPFLALLLCTSIPLGIVRAGIPPAPLTQSTARPKRPDTLNADDKVRILSERGSSVSAVLQFIENVSALMQHPNATCRRMSLDDFAGFEWRQTRIAVFEKQMISAVKFANILNHYFLTTPNDTDIDALFFYSLVKANVESDPSLSSSTIILPSATSTGEYFVPFTYRGSDGKIRTRNLANWLAERWSGTEWFWVIESGNYSELLGQVKNGRSLKSFILRVLLL
ncbi:hypothetical protein JTE90_021550 [Oedothorax gibbosus]|uniref:Uncharacterized protein n=1 Tax=Oedothorax gibbosus TaxID=931172 RepID=A0AAV6VS48_9ARAC|nr:hypothetical protein JTE90_021550 [Oedothorax gibbosus]